MLYYVFCLYVYIYINIQLIQSTQIFRTSPGGGRGSPSWEQLGVQSPNLKSHRLAINSYLIDI